MIEIIEQRCDKVVGKTSFFIKSNYNEKLISILKNIDGASYNDETKIWEIPINGLSKCIDDACLIDSINIKFLKKEIKKETVNKINSKFKTKPFNYQIDGINFGLNNDKWLLLDAPGLGKALTLDTPVLTSSGYKLIRDVNVGEEVFDKDGNLCKVTATYNHTKLNMYKVTLSTGETFECCEDHQHLVNYEKAVWNPKTKNYIRTHFSEVHDTKWLLNNNNYKKNCCRIPFCNPVNFEERQVYLDPYLIGILLGDGYIKTDISFSTKDEQIIEEFKKLLPQPYVLKSCGGISYRVVNENNIGKNISQIKNRNEIKKELTSLGLFGLNTYNKHIPDIYKYNSVKNRIKLLQGLMDTDGYALSNNSNCVQFSTSSFRLAEDVEFLINSLGGYITKKESYPSYFNDKYNEYRISKNKSYTLTFHLPDNTICFRLKRKLDRVSIRKFKPRRKFKNIEFIGVKEGKCLTVDSPSHTYLIKNCIVTHNTLQAIYIAQEIKKRDKLEHCLIICGVNTLKNNWKNEILKHSNLSCRILGERQRKNGKVYVGGLKERLEDLNKNIKEYFVITNIETLRESKIVKALTKGKNKFDLIIFDEAHAAKNPNSAQSKGLIKLNAKYKIAMTGTVLTNTPLDAYIPLKWIGEEKSNFSTFRYFYCSYGGPFRNEFIGYKNLDLLKYQLNKCSLRRTKDLLDLPPKTIIHQYVDLSSEHEKFYNNVKKGIKEEVDKVKLNTASVLGMVTRLRQAVIDPSILTSENIKSSKLEYLVNLVEQILYNKNEKVVIYSTYKQPLNTLIKNLSKYKPLLCTGDVADSTIAENIKKFQEEDENQVMLCTISKMGTGITLTRASTAIFIDCSYTAAQNSQAEDRIYRIGSKNPVFIYYLWCKDTIDDRIKEIVEDKSLISDYIIDDKISTQLYNRLKNIILDI